MLKAVVGVLAVIALGGEASAQVKQCGALDIKCINNNFAVLQKDLTAANARIDGLTTRVQALENKINDPNTGLGVVNSKLNGNWHIISHGEPPGLCLFQSAYGVALKPCDNSATSWTLITTP